jgi:methionyl-tRNA formyltransferase
MIRAVIFANSNVGARCLDVLLAAGVDVPLVVTHPQDPQESAFLDVEAIARDRGVAVALPHDANESAFVEQVARHEPEFIFSFYYRQLLKPALLDIATRGALNMHGSLLPKYRGRVPVNWAVIRGERETGATLHYMTEKPDAGDVVDQQPVPILPDDTAFDVFNKITVAAEIVLWRSMPALVRGDAPRVKQDASAATYFGRRRPEDGRIDWSAPAQSIHDLVRGVAPPYPGSYTIVHGRKVRILRTRMEPHLTAQHAQPTLYFDGGRAYIDCADGHVLRVIHADVDGAPPITNADQLSAAIGGKRRLI